MLPGAELCAEDSELLSEKVNDSIFYFSILLHLCPAPHFGGSAED